MALDPFDPLSKQRINRPGAAVSSQGQSGGGGGSAGGGGSSKLDQTNRIAAIATPLGANTLVLRGVSITEALGRLPSFEVDMISEEKTIDPRKLLGQTVSIRLNLISGKRFFHGHVVQFGRSASPDRYFAYQATVVPWLWFLTRTSNCRIFQNKNVPDIIAQIFKEHGFEFQSRLTDTYTPWEYCVQYRETDFNFVSRLMEQEGIYYFFQYEENKHVLVLADSPGAHQPLPGYEKISFLAPGQHGLEEHREHIREFIPQMNHLSGVYVHSDFDFEKPRADLVTLSQLPGEYARPDGEVFDYPGEYVLHSDGEDWARTRMEEIHAQIEIASGWGDTRGLAAGRVFTLTNPEYPEQAGKYLVTSARHSLRTNEYESGRHDEGPVYACRFLVQPAARPFRPARVTPKPRIQGVQTAIVTGPSGEEIFTDKFGRIKVQFHWDREGKADENTTCFMRVSQFWAGRHWGAMFLPRIGQEVVVSFLEGDPDMPLVTGSVYNADQMPFYPLPQHKTKSTIKSNSSKGGQGFNELRFEDKKGGEQVFIHSEKRMDVRVKGSVFETNGGNRDINIGAKSEKYPGGHLSLTVGADTDIHINGALFERVEKKLNQSVVGDVVEDYGANLSTIVKAKVELNAKEITLEALTKITLKVGSSFIMLDAGGITIVGPMVKINSGGSATGTGNPEIEDPLDAEPADTGEPGFLERPRIGGGGGRKKRTLNSQHAPTTPTAAELQGNPVVLAAIAQAWTDSQPNDPAHRHEEGGWIYKDTTTGAITTQRAPAGEQAGLDLTNPPVVPGSVVVGKFHTHPNPTSEGWEPGPSDQDRRVDARHGVPDLIRADDGPHLSGPDSRRGGLGGGPGYPP